jgi:hypothetical protein
MVLKMSLSSNRRRRTSCSFRMDSLLAGTLILPWRVHCAGYDVQRRCACQNIPGNAKAIPGSGENRSPSRRNRCSPSARNPVRLRPESARSALDEMARGHAGRNPSPLMPKMESTSDIPGGPNLMCCCDRLPNCRWRPGFDWRSPWTYSGQRKPAVECTFP